MNVLILRTGGGKYYAGRIADEIKALGHTPIVCPYHDHQDIIRDSGLTKANTILHTRAAYPSKSGWMGSLFALEAAGWKIFNGPGTIWLTSNKYECAQQLILAGIKHPTTLAFRMMHNYPTVERQLRRCVENCGSDVVAKPLTSNGQGVYVRRLDTSMSDAELLRTAREAGGGDIMIQTRVPYTAIYRVVVLDGEPITTVWRDRPTPTKWQVSVCINRNMEVIRRPDQALLDMAVEAQKIVKGKINFIDIFETPDGFVMSEINTACNLKHHERLSRINLAKRIAKSLLTLGGVELQDRGSDTAPHLTTDDDDW